MILYLRCHTYGLGIVVYTCGCLLGGAAAIANSVYSLQQE